MNRVKFFAASFIASFALVLGAAHVFAAGGGGGGTPPSPSCNSDTWICSDWSLCSVSGSQTRTCMLSFDCPSAESPRPSEQQSCAPTCTADTWSCNDWGSCSSTGRQTRTCSLSFDCATTITPTPPEEQNCITSAPQQPSTPQQTTKTSTPCSKDTWICGSWSVCDADGTEHRSCRRTFDCPSIDTPKPEDIRRCQELQCGAKKNMRDRIRCRLELTPAALIRELEIQYLPEECRSLTEPDRTNCIQRYVSYQPCWKQPVGEARNACAMRVLGLGSSVVAAVRECQQKDAGQDRAACMRDKRSLVYNMIKFRIYDLEERAEDLAQDGKVDINRVADFVNLIELKKQEFNKASTKEQRRQIILDVRNDWRDLISNTAKK